MYSFKNDYSEGAHPSILSALTNTNMEQEAGYGLDSHSRNAISIIKEMVGDRKTSVNFISGGTQINLIAISSFLKPYEACISATSGHINVHEAGAIEYTGHKILTVESKDGKLSLEGIQAVLDSHSGEEMVKPKLVYISNSTELGTVYTKKELERLSDYCTKNDLLLYCDGARLGSALCYEEAELTLKDMCQLTDGFTIGGTKNGALLGEALVISNERLQEGLGYHIKQKGGLLSKGRLLGIQFETLFQDGLYFKLASHANNMASKIVKQLSKQGIRFFVKPETNQLFPIFKNSFIEELSKDFDFYVWNKIDDNNSAVRLVTSWATTEESVARFISRI